MSCGCGKPKCDGHCGASPAVLQINNPSECTLFHRVEVPASLGDSKTNPPKNGAYKNVLLFYEADQTSWLYSSDGIPTKLTYATTDYNALTNKPTINGVTLEGNQSSSSLGININDATLTIKQGDTTLGTFSANASENVEINVGSSPIRLSVELDANPTWSSAGAMGPLFYYGQGGISGPRFNCVGVQEFYSSSAVSFRNEDTDELLSVEAVFSLLEEGKDIIVDNIPAVYHDTRTSTYYIDSAIIKGVKISQAEQVSGEGDFQSSRYIGLVAMRIVSPDGIASQSSSVYNLTSRFSIIKDVYSQTDIEYYIGVDGVEDSMVAD